ncbi:MAG: nicotinamide riboside transporter PnuC [Acidobacteria bacterium]|nr:nicotinamide riboside transporter PnuC [Acidobacteriota bacterium]
MGPFEIVGVVTGILGVWLTTRQKIWCWPVGLVSVIAFIVVFFEAKLYAAMGLQVVYVVLASYGWYAWLHGGTDHGELRVSRISNRILVPLTALGLASTALLGVWLQRRTDEALPFLDAFTTSFSLVAQWMQTRKHLENWSLWVVVDLIYISMSLTQGLRLTAGLYAVYVVLALLGYRDWRRSMTVAREPA